MKTGILKLREHVDKRQGKIKAKGKQSYPHIDDVEQC